MIRPPVIFDCDGVLLKWEQGFAEWCKDQYDVHLKGEPREWDLTMWTGLSKEETFGMVRQFNSSTAFGNLVAEKWASDVCFELSRRGHPLFLLSSCGRQAKWLREKNIERRIGNFFSGVFCVDLGESKVEHLAAMQTLYGPCVWVEDNVPNAMLGRQLGHRSFILRRRHNRKLEQDVTGAVWIDSLRELLSLLT